MSRLLHTFAMMAMIISCCMALPCPLLAAEPPATLRVLPDHAQAQVGATVELQVRINDVQGLYGLDVRLAFDPAILEVVDGDPAKSGLQLQTGQLPYPDFVVKNEADNAAGTGWYAVVQLNPREPASGSGVVTTVRFHAKAKGTSKVEFTYRKLADRTGTEITAGVQGTELLVTSAAGITPAQPTATMQPTPTFSPTRQPTTRPTETLLPTQTRTAQPTTAVSATRTPTPGPTMAAPTQTQVPQSTAVPTEPTATPLPPSATPLAPGPVPSATELRAEPTADSQALITAPTQAAATENSPVPASPTATEQSLPATKVPTPVPTHTAAPQVRTEVPSPVPATATPQAVVVAVPSATIAQVALIVPATQPVVRRDVPSEQEEEPLVSPTAFGLLAAMVVIGTAWLGLSLARRERDAAKRKVGR